jgi:hypothetical protein
LVAHRRGWRLLLRDVPPPLLGLLQLVGLSEVLARSAVEPGRQPELGEEGGEDEVVQPGDPTV